MKIFGVWITAANDTCPGSDRKYTNGVELAAWSAPGRMRGAFGAVTREDDDDGRDRQAVFGARASSLQV